MKKEKSVKTKPAPATATVPAKTAPAPRRQITGDLIAARAYTIWERKGRPQGHEVENWLLAEQQLKQETQAFSA